MPRSIGGVDASLVPALAGVGPAYGDLVYHGGPTISCPRIHASFWGPQWSDGNHKQEAVRLIQFLQDLAASTWMNVLSQYGAGTGPGSATFIGQSFVSTVSGTLSGNDIHVALQKAIDSGSVPEPPRSNTSEVIVIFLDESLAVKDGGIEMCEPSGDNAFGYHTSFSTARGNNCYYAVIPALTNDCIINTCPHQMQIGGNTTSSTPFVTPGDVVYFRGTDDKLWRVTNDGSGQAQIGGNTTSSTPFVTPDGWVWFQGTDDKLWKVFNDGTQQSQPRHNTTSSAPTVLGNWVYFRGTDDKLWQMRTDGSAQSVIGGNTTSSTPFVTADSIYFQGTDQTLWRYFMA
jgi:Domain of unknown function (DUF5050)